MDGEDIKTCGNCKHEIPAVNYTIHVVHCARNIRVCPTCKEPVPITELREHQEKLHKAVPCEKCGESVCGTDLEDHIRDSCAHTVKTCRFCELELPRGKLPSHENYCGTRTEQCPDCKEFVMIKYTQLHLDCNHGFLRLDDDPVPVPTRKPTNFPSPLTSVNINRPSTSYQSKLNGVKNNIASSNSTPSCTKAPSNINTTGNGINLASALTEPTPNTSRGKKSSPIAGNPAPVSKTSIGNNTSPLSSKPVTPSYSGTTTPNGNSIEPSGGLLPKSPNITNVNTESENPNDSLFVNLYQLPTSAHNTRNVPKSQNGHLNVDRNVKAGCSGVKKMPLKRTNDQPQININGGAAEKVHKDLSLSRGAYKKRPAPQPPRPSRSPHNPTSSPNIPTSPIYIPTSPMYIPTSSPNIPTSPIYIPTSSIYIPTSSPNIPTSPINIPDSSPNNPARDLALYGAIQRQLREERRDMMVDDDGDGAGAGGDRFTADQLRNLIPMTPQEFMDRFQELQLRKQSNLEEQNNRDRFNQIKSSLTELRRGLNQVTAPYVSQNAIQPNNDNAEPVDGAVRLPCEFCGRQQPAQTLVLHQTGCRPDLAQFRLQPASPPAFPPAPVEGAGGVLIPCEFCDDTLPVYMISEHQESCGLRPDNSLNMLSLD